MQTVADAVESVVDDHPDIAEAAVDGDESALHRLTGRVMEARGVGPATARDAVERALGVRDDETNAGGVDLDAFAAAAEAGDLPGVDSEWTADAYVSSVRKFREWYRSNRNGDVAPRAEEVADWLQYLDTEEGLAETTIGRHFYGLEAYFQFVGREGDLLAVKRDVADPGSGSARDPIPWADVEAMRAAAADMTPTDRAIVQLLSGFGMRLGELVALDVDDVRFDASELRVRRLKRKEHREDHLHLTDDDVSILRRYLDERWGIVEDIKAAADGDTWTRAGGEPAALFITNRLSASGWRASDDFIRARVAAAAETADVDADTVSPHRFRHSVATRLAGEGFTKEQIKLYLGHAPADATEHYMSLASETFREMREAIG